MQQLINFQFDCQICVYNLWSNALSKLNTLTLFQISSSAIKIQQTSQQSSHTLKLRAQTITFKNASYAVLVLYSDYSDCSF